MKIFMEDHMCTIYKLNMHKLEKTLKKYGHSIVNKIKDADICIAGVCAAFEADERRSVNIIKRMKKSGKPVYVYGCMTQVNPEKIDSPHKFASWRMDYLLNELIGKNFESWNMDKMPLDFRKKSDYRVYNPRKKFIGISMGCSFNCSYCPHRIGAGSIVSIPQDKILEIIDEVNASKVDTIVLTGTDTACYGKDINSSFADLLENILNRLKENIDVHIAQFNPAGLFFDRDKTMKLFSDKRIKDIQLPVQTTSQRLLKLMNRDYSVEGVDAFVKELRAKNKNVMIRTDIMLGFPTETQEELEKTINFVCDNFDEVAVYGFEAKKNTPISSLDLMFFPKKEIEKRRKRAVEKIKSAGLLGHSGGQKISTFVKSDRLKESRRGVI